MLKRKTMKRSEWQGIEERKFACMPVKNPLFSGIAGLLFMQRVENPFSVNAIGRCVQITGKGYTWLQLAPERENYWATVMFDENGRLTEQYFDITLENRLIGEETWFTDLILDVLMDDQGRTETLDEEELIEAFENGEISGEEYRLAKESCRKLICFMKTCSKEWMEMCKSLRETLLEKI